jgi:hypothetical protein
MRADDAATQRALQRLLMYSRQRGRRADGSFGVPPVGFMRQVLTHLAELGFMEPSFPPLTPAIMQARDQIARIVMTTDDGDDSAYHTWKAECLIVEAERIADAAGRAGRRPRAGGDAGVDITRGEEEED